MTPSLIVLLYLSYKSSEFIIVEVGFSDDKVVGVSIKRPCPIDTDVTVFVHRAGE